MMDANVEQAAPATHVPANEVVTVEVTPFSGRKNNNNYNKFMNM